MAHLTGEHVTVRQYAVLAKGEDLTEYPPTEVMPLAEWKRRHQEFDCDIFGLPLNPRPGAGVPVESVGV